MGKHRKNHRKKELYIVGCPLVMFNIAIEHGPIEIVDFPIHSMVDLSSSLCGCLPEGNIKILLSIAGP